MTMRSNNVGISMWRDGVVLSEYRNSAEVILPGPRWLCPGGALVALPLWAEPMVLVGDRDYS